MGDEESAPVSGAGRTNRRNRSSGTEDQIPSSSETGKVEDAPESTVATAASNVGSVPSKKKARAKRVVIAPPVPTRVPRMKKTAQFTKTPQFIGLEDPYEKIVGSKDKTNRGTGLVLHINMGNPECLWDQGYPEGPARFFCVIDRCHELGLLDRCKTILARNATKEEILRLHAKTHFDTLERFDCYDEPIVLEEYSSHYDAVFLHPSTYQTALLAAGSALNLVDSICTNQVTNGIAIVRPPGHHAMENTFNGYCFFNNVALAAKHAIEVHRLQRILIVDWDVHHGQGTQQLFYNDKRVLYFSIHRFENGSFWPNLAESNLDHIGDGLGKGYNINVPLNKTGLGNADYMAIFHHILLPVAYEYQPTLILVSAGYDAALGCPEGEMEVTPACFAHLLWSLKGLAQGNIAVIMEGGYCLKSLKEGVAMTLRALLGDPCPMMESLGEPDEVVKDTILRCIVYLCDHWKCYQNDYKMGLEATGGVSGRPIWPRPPSLTIPGENLPPFATRNCYPVVDAERNARYEQQLDNLIAGYRLEIPPDRVCYAYEVEMANYGDKSSGLEVESPSRILHTHIILEDFGLVARSKRLKVKPAQVTDIQLAHDKNYVDFLLSTQQMDVKELEGIQNSYNSVILKNTSFTAMTIAVGCLISVVDDVCSGLSRAGVAVIRPPGHHAEMNKPCGFCLVNNVAIAAKYAQRQFELKRVLIVDWDIHHGNGTQHIFYEDPSVLYISIHRYDDGRFFPSGPDGNNDKVGNGKGEGFNVNIPWSSGGMHDGDYLAAFTKIVMPVAYEYNPELVIISAGFDAAVNDPLGRCLVTPEAYGHFTSMLMSLANGRVIVSLEGGYNIHSVATCMASCMRALHDDPLPDLNHPKPSYGALKSIFGTINIQAEYWRSLRIKNAGANKRQILSGTHRFALKHFGQDYEEMSPSDQFTCFRRTMFTSTYPQVQSIVLEDDDATTLTSSLLNLELNKDI